MRMEFLINAKADGSFEILFVTHTGITFTADKIFATREDAITGIVEIKSQAPRAPIRDAKEDEVVTLNVPEDDPLKTVLMQLNPDEVTHWNKDGTPSTTAVIELSGKKYSAKEVRAEWKGMTE